jgi:MFS family permease
MEAFVYDDLKQNGDSKHYPKVSSNIETVTWTAWFLSSIAGGYLYFWNFRSPWIITGLLFVAGAIMATRLVEPKIDSIKVHLKAAIRQNLAGFRELFRTPKIRNITLQLAIVGAGYIIASGILGNSQAREYGMDARGVGWLFGIGCLASVVASRYFTKLKEMLGEQKLIALTTTALLASFLVARYVGVVAGSLLIIMRIASSSTFRNTRSVIVNEWISSKNRATALSTLSLISQTPYIFLAPLFGVMIDQSSPNNFAFMIGVAIIVGIIGMQINSKLYVRRK